MERVDTASAVLPLGVVVERQPPSPSARRWGAAWIWRTVAVLPGAPAPAGRRPLAAAEGSVRFHAATLPLRLVAGETEAYRTALSNDPPVLFSVLRPDGRSVRALLVTAAPFEAEQHLDCGDDIVDALPMPAAVLGWVRDFVVAHHVDRPFVKRRRHAPPQGREG